MAGPNLAESEEDLGLDEPLPETMPTSPGEAVPVSMAGSETVAMKSRMREIRTSGSVGAWGGKPPQATRRARPRAPPAPAGLYSSGHSELQVAAALADRCRADAEPRTDGGLRRAPGREIGDCSGPSGGAGIRLADQFGFLLQQGDRALNPVLRGTAARHDLPNQLLSSLEGAPGGASRRALRRSPGGSRRVGPVRGR